jgi:hypothetical protein
MEDALSVGKIQRRGICACLLVGYNNRAANVKDNRIVATRDDPK